MIQVPLLLRVTLTCATQIIRAIADQRNPRNPELSASQKDWMVKSLLAQQAKANPEPELRRALPLNQSADQGQIVAPQPIAGFPDSGKPWEVGPAQSVEGGYAGMNLPAEIGRSHRPVGVRQLNHPANIFQQDLLRATGPIGQSDMDTARNLFATTGASTGQAELAAAQRRLDDAKAGTGLQPYADRAEQERDDITLKDPEAPQAAKDAITAKREQDKQALIAGLQQDVETAKTKIAHSQAIMPGPEYQKTIPGTVSKFVGDNVPFLAAAVTGPFAPAVIATQMSESAYSQEHDKSYVCC